MSADGVIQIDLMLKGKDQFVTDVRFIDDLLEHLGTHTAKQMDASFQQQASKVINEAKQTKEQLKETMNHPFTFRLSAETEKANAQISETKQFLHEIPKRKKTVFDADTDNFTNHLRRLKETTNQTESRFSRLKEIMLGTFAGSMITTGIQQLIGGLKNAAEAGMEYNKEQDTMKTVWKALTEETPKDGQKLVNFINDVSNHSIFTAESINKMAQSFYHVHSNTEETERWTNSLVALGSTLHMTNDQVSEAGEMFAKVMASGKAGAQDIYMMINRFPMFGEALQQVTGKTMEELYALSARGKLTSEDFGKAMDYLGEKYKNGTEEAMTSMQGMSMYISKRWQQLWGEAETTLFDSNKRISKSLENLLSDKQISIYANALSSAFSGILDWIIKVMDYLDKHKDTIVAIIGDLKTILGIFANTVWTTIKDIFFDIANYLGLISKNGHESKDPLTTFESIMTNIAKNRTAIENVSKALLALFAAKKIGSFVTSLSEAFKGLKKLTAFTGIDKLFVKAFTAMTLASDDLNLSLLANPLVWIPAVIIAVGVAFYEAYKHIKPFREAVDKSAKSVYKFASNATKTVSNLFHKVVGWWDKLKSSSISKWDEMVEYVKGIPKKMGDALSAGAHWVGDGAKTIGNYLVGKIGDGVNGVIGGIDWVLDKVHAPKSVRITPWTVPKFATGGTHHGGLMMVNDGEGRELVRHPDGRMEIPYGRDVLMNAEPGTQVLSHQQTKMFAKMMGIPMYADGIGDFFSNIWEGIKDIGEDVVDAVSHPIKFVEKAIAKHVNLDATHPVLDIGLGAVKTMTEDAMDWLKSLINEFGNKLLESDGGGSGTRGQFLKLAEQQQGKPYVWGAAGPNAFDCSGLVMWALQQLGISFPHFSGAQFTASQPISEKDAVPGDLVFFGPGGTEHVGIVSGSNRMFNAMNPKDGIGFSSISGFSDVLAGFRRITQLTDHSVGSFSHIDPSGDTINRWRGQLIDALKANGLPTNESYISAWLRQISTESSGNPLARQGIIDLNSFNGSGGAMGLLQMIPPTFNAYKFPGHGNIFNGYDNMLAAINYAKHRYGAGMLSVIGHGHGYANGGWADQPSIFGEVPGQPEVAINPKRDSADRLIEEVIDVRSKEAPNSLSAKLKKFVVNAKHSVDAIYHESGTQTVASSIQPSSFENAHKGDIHLEVKLDNGEIFRQQIPLHQAY